MKRNLLLLLTLVTILSTTHRAPAPIVEESPSAATAAKPPPKARAKPKAQSRPSAAPKPTPISFAGTWATNFNNDLRVSQTGNHISGLYDGSRGVLDGTINGNILTGTWAWRNERGIFSFSLSLDGNNFNGTFTRSNGFTGPWTGIRKSH
jgi:hypothetical protein